ncbi:MAG TPA: DciA family protein [Thermoanaerobaculia bacterium]|nr:DciA family protein [Thermoanaerobaculia bacterium]
MKRRVPAKGFSALEAAADGVLRRMSAGESALLWIQARWPRIVGEPLSRKVTPAALSGRRLTLSLLDPAWRKPVEGMLSEIERKLAYEVPSVRPRVVLKQSWEGRPPRRDPRH